MKSVAITRNLEGFRDTKGLRHLVCHWSLSLHMFFFSVGEFTIALEDMVNNFLLSMFGDESPFDIQLSAEDLTVKERLFKHFSGRSASSRGKPARMKKWVTTLSKENDKFVRQVGFLALWLSKFLFIEIPGYGAKSVFFHLAIRLARDTKYALAPMFLSHVYS